MAFSSFLLFVFSSFFFSFSSHSQCDLTEIPSAIGRLVDLQEVTLAENPVTSLPGEESAMNIMLSSFLPFSSHSLFSPFSFFILIHRGAVEDDIIGEPPSVSDGCDVSSHWPCSPLLSLISLPSQEQDQEIPSM